MTSRDWLNKKHFTSDMGATLDCIAILPDDHAIAINIGQLCTLLDSFASSIQEAGCQQIEKLKDERDRANLINSVALSADLNALAQRVVTAEQQLADKTAESQQWAIEAGEAKGQAQRLREQLAEARAQVEKYTENRQVGTCVDCGAAIWFRNERMEDETGMYHPLCRAVKVARAQGMREAANQLAPWFRHKNSCSFCISAGNCDCGLSATFKSIDDPASPVSLAGIEKK